MLKRRHKHLLSVHIDSGIIKNYEQQITDAEEVYDCTNDFLTKGMNSEPAHFSSLGRYRIT